MGKKLLSVLLATVMLLTCIPLGAVSVSAYCDECGGDGYYWDWCYDCYGDGCDYCDYYGEREYVCEYCGCSVCDKNYTCVDCGGDGSECLACDYKYYISGGKAVIEKYLGDGGDVVIPSTLGGCPVTSIVSHYEESDEWFYHGAFEDCRTLTSVVIPEGVTFIEKGAFDGCSALTSIVIPSTVTTLMAGAFGGCRSLTAVHISDLAAWCKLDFYDDEGNALKNNPLYYAKNLYLNNELVTDLVIPGGVTEIGWGVFAGCNMNTVTIPEGVTKIGTWAFAECDNLTSVVIPDGVTSIGGGAFQNCVSLTSVTVPEGVKYIGEGTFNCPNLTSVTLPNSLTHIEWNAFYCERLSAVYYNGTKEQAEAIEIEEENDTLIDATWYYNGVPGTGPGFCAHDWADATCTAPKTCTLCGKTEGWYLDHDWADATCTAPKTCKGCGRTSGRQLGHDWTDATCVAPTSCVRCGETVGEALGHDYTGLTCTDVKACNRCSETTGELLGHDYAAATCTTPATCKRCGETTGEVSDHIYDNTCDAYCNTCDEWREVTHNYDNNCDYNCNTCGRWRDAPHNYDDACDVMCNDCFYLTWIVLAHEYDDITDTDCNLCGDVREYLDLDEEATVDIDEYGDAAFFLFTPEEDGYYTFSSDTGLAYGEIFAVASGYGFSATGYLEAGETHILMAMCRNEAGIVSGPFTVKMQKHTHTYTNDCDYYCNDSSCEAYRKAPPHNYENACDPDCNDCGNVRTDIHVWDDVCDTECNECGATRQVNYLTVEQDVIAEIVDGVPAEFVFIPEQSGIHTFYSTSDSDTYGYLLDANREELAHNDDGGEGYNFQITYSLVAGTPYILRCRFYGNGNGSFTVSADLTHAHVYDDACDPDCNDCQEVRVAPHNCAAATCTDAAVCADCGLTVGDPLGHDWVDATGSKICNRCGATHVVYSPNVAHSVMETDNGNGLAFWFELSAQGVVKERGNLANLSGATINYLGRECKLVAMGAVMTNNAAVGATAFTLEDVHGDNVIDVPAVYLQEADADSCAFAVRIIDIPDSALEHTIYARPYYVVEVDGQLITVYGDVDAASCAEYL